ncbi:MAG: hypothetical protein ABI895_13270 [Deltaproteobacteria bacterium]
MNSVVLAAASATPASCAMLLRGTLSFDYNDTGQVSDIFITRNPDKLARLDPVVIQ